MLDLEMATIDELQDTIIGAVTNIVIDKIAEFLWNEVGSVIDDTFQPSIKQQIWQQIAERLNELADNLQAYAQQLAKQ
jgi:hypothetical protein